LPLGGHRQAKENGEDPKPPGERQLKLNHVRWVCQKRDLTDLMGENILPVLWTFFINKTIAG